MKTIITILSIVAFTLIGNVANAWSKDNFYKNNEVNNAGQIVRTTICKGDSDDLLTFVKQFENKYDRNGNLNERIISMWDSNELKWIPKIKYQYEYNSDKQLQMLTHTKYNKELKLWENEVKYAMYIYDDNGNLLLVDYLNIDNKEQEVLASDF